MKKASLAILGMIWMMSASACASGTSETITTVAPTTAPTTTASETTSGGETTADETAEAERTASAFDQMAEPVAGDTIATITIKGFGDVKIRLFAAQAPKAAENFIGLAESGYYDGLSFHRVIKDFMIQGGDPTGTGSGGESVFGEAFEDEFNGDLVPIKGSLCMANSGANTNGSQFFMVTTNQAFPQENMDSYAAQYKQYYGKELDFSTITDRAYEYLQSVGGAGWLYGQHTVFGQVYEGLDILEQAEAVETGSDDKPVEDLIIEKVTISTYEG